MKKKVDNLLISLPKLEGGHSRFKGTTIQIKMENNSHQTPSPNTIPMWLITIYFGRKGHIVFYCKDKTWDCVNGVFKSQANVVTQVSSTSTLISLAKTFQLFMAIVAK